GSRALCPGAHPHRAPEPLRPGLSLSPCRRRMPNYFLDNEDLRYYFDSALDWEALEAASPWSGGGAAQLRSFIERVGALAATEVAPAAAAIDAEGLALSEGEVVEGPARREATEALRGLGLYGLTLPRELGGGGAPTLLYFIHAELLARADASIMARYCHHGGIAMAALALSLSEG